MMNSSDIDDDGNWLVDGVRLTLLGTMLPIPADITESGEREEEEVLFIMNMDIETCPACKEESNFQSVVIGTINYRLMPTRCCNRMAWLTEVK